MQTSTQHRAIGTSLEDVQAPLAFCTFDGKVVRATDDAAELFARLDAPFKVGASLPSDLWKSLEDARPGAAVEWRPPSVRAVLGCTRYRTPDGWMLMMKEVSYIHAEISRRLHRQRLEVTGRLVASIAHELRNSVSSIVYSADLLRIREELPEDAVDDTVKEIMFASRRLQAIVDGLLDYARLGPTVSVRVSLEEVLTRAQGFLRSYYKDGSHRLHVELAKDACCVQGNSITVEQIFVNLLLNAAEAATEKIDVWIVSALVDDPRDSTNQVVRIRVIDNGPGIPPAIRESIFEPFVTGREAGTGLGLTNALEAVKSLGGSMELEDTPSGATFTVYLPRAEVQ